jgi:hypothetical protein
VEAAQGTQLPWRALVYEQEAVLARCLGSYEVQIDLFRGSNSQLQHLYVPSFQDPTQSCAQRWAQRWAHRIHVMHRPSFQHRIST